MGGLGILLIIGLYLALTVTVIVKAKPFWQKGLVLLLALLIPSADAVYGRYKLKKMCEAEGGLKVYNVAYDVDGFIAESADGFYIKTYGYKFTEAKRMNGTYYRAVRQNGAIIIEDNIKPRSVYMVRQIVPKNANKTYSRIQYVVEKNNTKEVLAVDSQIGFNGGWVERQLAKFGGGGISPTWCSFSNWITPKNILNASLKRSGEK